MQQVEDKLRRMILDMEIGPGERLTERWVEGQLGASRTSVRTALFRLEAEGLVSREGRGWIVPPIDLKEIEQLFAYREVLEVAAIRLGGRNATESEVSAIEATLKSVTADAAPDEIELAGRRFHLWIAGLAQNDFIRRGVNDALIRLQRARWLETDARHDGWDEHRVILAALRQGEVERAAELMEAHIRETRDRLLEAIRKGRRSLRARGAAVLG